jgi:hypothetical protein
VNADLVVSPQVQKSDEPELIAGAFSQGASSAAESCKMNEISFPLLGERPCSILLGCFGKKDFFKHILASVLMEARSCPWKLNETLIPPGLRDKETV